MTRKAVEKIEGTIYETTLRNKKEGRQYLEDAGRSEDAARVRASIAGYVQSLRDCGVITESERKALYLYYGTI